PSSTRAAGHTVAVASSGMTRVARDLRCFKPPAPSRARARLARAPARSRSVPVDNRHPDGREAIHRLEHRARILERHLLVDELPGAELPGLDHAEHRAEA